MPRRPQKQTGNADANLQEQVTSLTLENERLKAILAQHGLKEVEPQDARLANALNVTRRARGAERTVIDAPTTPVTPRSMLKGCSCRGNCSTRVCGCVKKNIPCSEACKCGDVVCQNQEQDKENTGGEENQAAAAVEDRGKARKSKQLSDSNVNKETNGRIVAPAPKTRAKRDNRRQGLFSPEPTDKVFDKDVRELANASLRFGSDSEPEAPQNDRDGSNDRAKNRTASGAKNRGNEEQTLQLPKRQRQLRSLSNKEEATEPQEAKKARDRRSVSAGRRNTKASNETVGKTLAALINGVKSLRKTVGANKAGSSRAPDSNEPNDIEARQAAEKKAPAPKKTTRKNKKKKRSPSSEINDDNVDEPNTQEAEEASNHNENDETNAVSEARLEQEEAKDDGQEPAKKSDEINDNKVEIKVENENNNVEEHVEEPDEENSKGISRDGGKYQSSDSSPGSDAPSTSSSYRLRDTEDFDPMKPTHNLTRSPLAPRQEHRHYAPLDISERPLPMPLEEEPAIELPPPDELNEPVVDWEKHQAERVHCRKCGRGFYPYRIKKHEASCQKL